MTNEQAIRILKSIRFNVPFRDCPEREALSLAIKALEERPMGKWIEYDDDGLYAGECSCCKWKAVLYESNVLNMNFCPNCGARMER